MSKVIAKNRLARVVLALSCLTCVEAQATGILGAPLANPSEEQLLLAQSAIESRVVPEHSLKKTAISSKADPGIGYASNVQSVENASVMQPTQEYVQKEIERKNIEALNQVNRNQPRVANKLASSPRHRLVSRTEARPNFLTKIDVLEKEMRELRGIIEVQQHVISQLQDSQRTMYRDLDSRLTQVKSHLQTPDTVAGSDTTVEKGDAKPGDQANLELDHTQEQKIYALAYNLIKAKKYTQATAALKAYLSEFPQGHYAVNAHYWVGELSLLSGKKRQATHEFNMVVKNYPDSSKVPDAMLKLGYIYAEEGQWHAAKSQFDSIMHKYPNSSSSRLADQRLRQLKAQGH